jgi:hypothetical protein
MPPRYTTRRTQGEPHYSVWDNDRHRIATSEGRECIELGFDEALDLADKLNDENRGPKQQARPTVDEQPAAQQQQPQPKKE